MTDRDTLRAVYAELQAADSSTMTHEYVRHLQNISALVTIALNKDPEANVDDAALNRMAQYLYEGISIAPDLTLYMDMTSKATLVRVLREAMIRAGIVSDMNAWTVAMLHLPDCPLCEQCINLAVDAAKATGQSGGSWQMLEPMPDGTHSIMHRAVVERKR